MRTIGRALAVLGLAAVVLVLAAPVAAAEPRTAGQFSGEETVVAVEIPVQVLVDGTPVRGLGPDDFEVLEGRKARPILGFDVVDLSLARARGGRSIAVDPDVIASGRRHFLLLFDLSNSSPLATSRAREAARNLVRTSLHPTDLVAVATWSFTKGPKLLLAFTSDRRQVESAVDSLGIVELRNRAADPLALIIAGMEGASTGGGASGFGSVGEGEFLEMMKNFATFERAAARQTKDSELSALTAGFGGLAHLLANVAGRKYVVLLSQGFDSSTLTGSVDPDLQQDTTAAVEAGEVWKVNSDERFGSTRSVKKLDQMLDEFRRADCSIQAVDIGGLTVGVDTGDVRRASGRDSLATMAHDTGGNLFERFNDLGQAMDKMLAATSVTYVLTIQPEDLKLDGKYHAIKVRLKGGPPGARLSHRPGYTSPTPYAQRGGGARQLETAQLLLSGQPGGILVGGVVAEAFRGDGKKAHVPVIVELDGKSLLEAIGDQAAPVSFFLYAIDDLGQIRDFVAQELQLDLGKLGARLRGEPLKFVADLRLVPGDYALRSLVRVGTTGAYLLVHDALAVPAFAEQQLVVGRPLFPEPMTSGVVVRSSSSAERTKGLPFPFALGEEFYLPRALPHLPAGGAIRACLNTYGLDASAVTLAGELVDGRGQVVPGASLRVLRRLPDAAGLQRFEIQVDAGSVPAGDYSLRVALEQNGRKSLSSAALSVSH